MAAPGRTSGLPPSQPNPPGTWVSCNALALGLSPVVALAQLEDAFMHRIVGGILVLVLGIAVVAAEDEGQDKQSATPEQQYKAILKEYNDAFQAYAKAYGEAKTPEEQQK